MKKTQSVIPCGGGGESLKVNSEAKGRPSLRASEGCVAIHPTESVLYLDNGSLLTTVSGKQRVLNGLLRWLHRRLKPQVNILIIEAAQPPRNDDFARSALKGPIALVPYCPIALRSAFTMAEILLSLTIIGVVAAITLPSLTGNINERTWNTQRKALYSRMSQAIALMPALNGYGSTDENAAETFITSGLSKVLKINNICSNDSLYDCGFASQIVDGGGVKQNLPQEVKSLNAGIINWSAGGGSVPNTKAAAFETANGESILTFYNPSCTAANVKISTTDGSGNWHGYYAKKHVCANFIYDLNGKKGPNTVGKDIGAITVTYATDSRVEMPMNPKSVASGKTQDAAANICRELGEGQYRLPNTEELLSLYYNRLLYDENIFGGDYLWSGTLIDASYAHAFGNSSGINYALPKYHGASVVCVERF